MKRMLICCGALCMMLALFCGTAFAAVDVQSSDASVTVTKNADETQFTVNKTSGVTAGQLYLVMIQKGAATDLPTEQNLYYVDVDKAEDASFTKTAYPKNLEAGTYTVFLSDYGAANGGRKAVATLTVGTPGGNGGNGEPGGNTHTDVGGETGGNTGLKLGDVNDDTYIDASDAYLVMRIFSGMKKDNAGTVDWSEAELKAANVDGSEYVDASDSLLIMQHFVGLVDDNFKRK